MCLKHLIFPYLLLHAGFLGLLAVVKPKSMRVFKFMPVERDWRDCTEEVSGGDVVIPSAR